MSLWVLEVLGERLSSPRANQKMSSLRVLERIIERRRHLSEDLPVFALARDNPVLLPADLSRH